jgi:hypothetical protein
LDILFHSGGSVAVQAPKKAKKGHLLAPLKTLKPLFYKGFGSGGEGSLAPHLPFGYLSMVRFALVENRKLRVESGTPNRLESALNEAPFNRADSTSRQNSADFDLAEPPF